MRAMLKHLKLVVLGCTLVLALLPGCKGQMGDEVDGSPSSTNGWLADGGPASALDAVGVDDDTMTDPYDEAADGGDTYHQDDYYYGGGGKKDKH